MPKALKDMTADERREFRKKQRENKKKGKLAPPEPAPRFNRQKKKDVQDRKRKSSQKKREDAEAAVNTPLNITRAEEGDIGDSFEDMFLDIIRFLPSGEQRDRAMSMFAVFRRQPPDVQRDIVDSLMDQAKGATGPIFEQQLRRLEEDADFQKSNIQRNLAHATATFNRLKSTLDFNAIRDKAKVNKALSDVVRRVNSRGFVTGVKGTSGLLRRRTEDARFGSREKKVDIDIQKKQQIQSAQAALSKTQAEAEAMTGRVNLLEDRGVEDILEQQKEDERSLFLDLFSNQNQLLTDQALANIQTGAVGSTDLEDLTRTTGEDAVSSISGIRAASRQVTNEKAVAEELRQFDERVRKQETESRAQIGRGGHTWDSHFANRDRWAAEREDIINRGGAKGVIPGVSSVGSFQAFLSGQSASAKRVRSISAAQALSGVGVQRVGNTIFTDASAPQGSSLQMARDLRDGKMTPAQFAAARNALMMGGAGTSVDRSSTSSRSSGTSRFSGANAFRASQANKKSTSRVSSSSSSRISAARSNAAARRKATTPAGRASQSRSAARGLARASR